MGNESASQRSSDKNGDGEDQDESTRVVRNVSEVLVSRGCRLPGCGVPSDFNVSASVSRHQPNKSSDGWGGEKKMLSRAVAASIYHPTCSV